MPPDTKIELQNEILADRLAKAVVYLQAIENALDRFDASDPLWLVGQIVARANKDVYHDWRHTPWKMESFRIIRAVLIDKELSILDSAEYEQCLIAIKNMVHKAA